MTLPLALLPVFAFAALAVFGAICAAAGAWWMKARDAATLRRTAEDRGRLLALADHWVWETDAAHRLTAWRPPAHRPAGWRTAPELGRPLIELAGESATAPLSGAKTGSAEALSRQMAAGAPIPAQRVVLSLGGAAQAWSLRGEPRMDGAGRFCGYLGSAVPVGEAEASAFLGAALTRLLPHLDA
ncbi:MAG: hypothetical protein ABW032_01450, partial [Burkholderiaceae bacterium]